LSISLKEVLNICENLKCARTNKKMACYKLGTHDFGITKWNISPYETGSSPVNHSLDEVQCPSTPFI
jgi:hypothetical protein